MNDCERKLTVELHSLIAEFKSFRELMIERDRLYSERDDGNKERVAMAFAAAEKAALKTEEALKEYKESANEWRKTVSDLISMQQGSGKGMEKLWGWLAAAFVAIVAVIGLYMRRL